MDIIIVCSVLRNLKAKIHFAQIFPIAVINNDILQTVTEAGRQVLGRVFLTAFCCTRILLLLIKLSCGNRYYFEPVFIFHDRRALGISKRTLVLFPGIIIVSR